MHQRMDSSKVELSNMCKILWKINKIIDEINSTYTVDNFNVFTTREYASSTDGLGSAPVS